MDSISLTRIATLHPRVREQVKQVLASLSLEPGTTVRITQALRTFDEQDALFAKGRTAPGKKVTNASAGQSIHNYGLAFDYALLKNGKLSWQIDADWEKVAQAFKEASWQWGGDWKSFKDYPHLEKTYGLSWQQLLKKHREGDFLQGTKYVNL